MSTRKIKDAKDLETNELIYFKGHAKATYMSDGRNVEEAINDAGTYSKPSGGIPKSDLATDVQTSLNKANTALQEHQDISKKINGDGTITKIVKVSALPNNPDANTLYIIV
jgi:hypothetical protein